MNLTVRPAQLSDIPEIVRLHEHPHIRDYLNPPSEDDVEGAFSRPSLAQYVISSETAVEGLLLLAYHDDWMIEISRLAVAHPGCGTGRFALEWALAYAFESRKVNRVYLEVTARNKRARQLYKRAGFRYEGTFRAGARHWKTGAFEDLCAYGKLVGD